MAAEDEDVLDGGVVPLVAPPQALSNNMLIIQKMSQKEALLGMDMSFLLKRNTLMIQCIFIENSTGERFLSMMFCFGEDNEPGNDNVIITPLTGLRGGTMTALSRGHTT